MQGQVHLVSEKSSFFAGDISTSICSCDLSGKFSSSVFTTPTNFIYLVAILGGSIRRTIVASIFRFFIVSRWRKRSFVVSILGLACPCLILILCVVEFLFSVLVTIVSVLVPIALCMQSLNAPGLACIIFAAGVIVPGIRSLCCS